jgi:hypothetical protein
MRVPLLAPLTATLVAGTIGLTATAAAAAPAAPSAPATQAARSAGAAVPVTGTTADGRSFAGTLTVQRFTAAGGALQAVGQLAGTVTDPTTGATTTLAPTAVTAPAAVAGASCTILDLVLGPLHLDLLGLVVDLNQVHLTITAQQGAGNLLGNLLCAVANLLNGSGVLNGGGALNGLAALLNQVLGALGTV